MSDRTENIVLVLPGLLLLAFAFFVPIAQMLVLSVQGEHGPTLAHFSRFLGDSYYLGVLWRTVRLSIVITAICTAIGFPLAYIMAHVEEAARTMGCSLLTTVRTVVLPLSLPGIVAGSLLVFTLSASSFVTPNLLGGSRIQVLATSIYRSVTQTLDWPFAAAQAVILFVGVLLMLLPYARLSGGRNG